MKYNLVRVESAMLRMQSYTSAIALLRVSSRTLLNLIGLS